MATFIYPSNDYERSSNLLAVLGSWWSDIYEGQALVGDLVEATAQREIQNLLNTLDLISSISRHNIPVFHREQWYPLRFRASQRNTTQASEPRYDEPANYQYDISPIFYDRGVSQLTSTFLSPEGIVDIPIIVNRILMPSLSWTHGVDYVLDLARSAITFRTNPFTNNLIPKVDILENGQIVDQEVLLWAFRSQLDHNDLHTQFGYVLGLQLRSSEAYKELINALFDALVEGTTLKSVQRAWAAFMDIPLVVEPVEIVERIEETDEHQFIITDSHVYRFSTDVEVMVAEGDRVFAGQSLTNALQIHEFNRGLLPEDLSGLILPRTLLDAGYFADLLFLNETVPLVVSTTDPSGKTRLEWDITGFPGDVSRFFDELHEKGVAAGQTLANLLDVRPAPVGEPTAASLPTTINPLEFLVENVYRNNAFLVRIRVNAAGPSALGLDQTFLFRKIIPPHTMMIILAELSLTGDDVIMDGPGTDVAPGYDDAEASLIQATEPFEELVDDTSVNETGLVFRPVGGHCV